MGCTLRAFRAEDLLACEVRAEGPLPVPGPARLWRLAVQYEELGPAFTLWDADDRVVACGGVAIQPPGVGSAWLIASPLVDRHPVALHRAAQSRLDRIIRFCQLHRVQTVLADGFPQGLRWLERLGFHREALLRKAGRGGADLWMLVRFVDGV